MFRQLPLSFEAVDFNLIGIMFVQLYMQLLLFYCSENVVYFSN